MDKCDYREPQSHDAVHNTCGLNLVDLNKKFTDSAVRAVSPEGAVGSGFIISNGNNHLVITDEHVLDDHSDQLEVQYRGKSYLAFAVTRDKTTDIAIMKLKENLLNPQKHELKPFTGIPKVNEPVVTIGFPLGVKEPQLSPGYVIERDSYYRDQVIINSKQACNFGNSGSMQLRADGTWWGIQQAVGPHYQCTSLGAENIVPLIKKVPGWENYGTRR